MTDLKELIEQEIDQYLEWPTTDKSHVTTTSAKLFAEHVARLYADHIPDAGKMVSDQLRGGTKKIGRPQIREVFVRNGAVIPADRDDLPDYVYESVLELLEMAAPAVQGEPVALPPFATKIIEKLRRFDVCAEDGQDVDIGRHWLDMLVQLGLLNRVQRSPALWEMAQQGEDVLEGYTAPQPAEQQPARRKTPMSYPNGLDMESMPGLVEALEMGVDMVEMDGSGKESVIDSPLAALAAHRKQGGEQA